jgi:hypothetical protein
MLRATFKSRSLGYPELVPLPLRRNEDMIGSGGSIASTLGTENTSFATGWPMRRPIAKSEKDWSIGFAKCITNESGAGAVENENGSYLIPGDEPVLASFGRAHDSPWAGCQRWRTPCGVLASDRDSQDHWSV